MQQHVHQIKAHYEEARVRFTCEAAGCGWSSPQSASDLPRGGSSSAAVRETRKLALLHVLANPSEQR